MADRTATRTFRRDLLKAILRADRRAIATSLDARDALVEAIRGTEDLELRSLMRRAKVVLDREAAEQRAVLAAAFVSVGGIVSAYHEGLLGEAFLPATLPQTIAADAFTQTIAGKTLGERITTLKNEQLTAVRLRLMLGIRRGDPPASIARSVAQLYGRGDVGAAYKARRIVQSELTRFQGEVMHRAAALAYERFGTIEVLGYRTQGDQRVRDTHAAMEGSEFAADDAAGVAGLPPVSEAQSYLGEPMCRCWLEVTRTLDRTGRDA